MKVAVDRRRRLRRRRAAPTPAAASRRHRVRGHQPEPGREADRRARIPRWRRSPTRASRARRPARRRAGATSCSSASSTASRRGWRARCSTPARASSSTWRPTSGCAIRGSTSGSTGRTPRPSWCTASATAWPTSSGCRLRGATAIAAPGLLRDRGAARAVSAGLGRARRDAVALRRHRLERRGRAAAAHDAPSDARPQPLRLLGAGPPARGGGPAVVARVDRPARRDGPAHDALGAVRAGHLPHAARLRAEGDGHPRRRAGHRRRGWYPRGLRRAARSSACSTRRPSSPTPWAPTTR